MALFEELEKRAKAPQRNGLAAQSETWTRQLAGQAICFDFPARTVSRAFGFVCFMVSDHYLTKRAHLTSIYRRERVPSAISHRTLRSSSPAASLLICTFSLCDELGSILFLPVTIWPMAVR